MSDDNKGQVKRASLTSRASKIPQRVSSFLRPSNSTLTTTTITATGENNEKLSTRLSHILWRQRQQQQSNVGHNDTNDTTCITPPETKPITKAIISEDEQAPISPVSLTDSSTTSSSHHHFSYIITAHSNQLNKSNYMMTIPSVIEYADDFADRCARLLCLEDIEFTHAPVLEMLLESAQLLVRSSDTPIVQKNALQKRFDQIQNNIQLISKTSGPKTDLLKKEIEKLQIVCQNCLRLNSNSPSLCITSDLFRKESAKIVQIEPDYNKSDQIDINANWFRHHFVGKPYITLIGAMPPNQDDTNKLNAIVSIIQERAKDFGNTKENQYRIIIRNQETVQSRFIVHECIIKETISTKPLLEKPKEQPKRLRSLRSIQPINPSSRLLRAALLSVCPNIDLSLFKELSAESTILSGLEKDLLKYDEIQIPKHYKFGVLLVKEGQTTEEQWFSNTGLTKSLEEFMNIMGESIELKGYKGYAAGLDTKTGESGSRSYKTSWNGQDIIFHVAPLMPSPPHSSDKQHVFRKKHIGNDIVCIIFIQGNQQFNPKAIRSQFLHVYIVVRPEIANGKRQWRVEVIRNKNVSSFGPVLPSPPVFDNPDQLKAFLTLKLVSAENAALKSKKFFIPNNKARQSILASHIQTGSTFVAPEIVRSVSSTRFSTDSSNLKLQRPRSFNNNNRRSRFDSPLQEVIPPIPTVSRSTLLQDFKKGFARKKVNLE